jgi:hypothetical protein
MVDKGKRALLGRSKGWSVSSLENSKLPKVTFLIAKESLLFFNIVIILILLLLLWIFILLLLLLYHLLESSSRVIDFRFLVSRF